MADRTVFDHLAIALPSWSDGYPTLVTAFGGRWTSGGVTETFSPGQLEYDGQMKLELLAPGSGADGFVSSFLAGHGPGPHHITFKVRDMDAFAAGAEALGYELMGAHIDIPGRRETFIHPKVSGFGTLLQALEYEEHHESLPPDGFPSPSAPAHGVAWVALVVPELDRAVELFAGVLDGEITSRGERGGGRWSLLSWPPGRRLLVMDTAVPALGCEPGSPGIDHVVFVPPGGALPHPDDLTSIAEVPGTATLGLTVLSTTTAEAITR